MPPDPGVAHLATHPAANPAAEVASNSELVIVVAPTARDAQATCRILAAAGLQAQASRGLDVLAQMLEAGAGALIVTDATLGGDVGAAVLDAVARQPAWSNLPVLALCGAAVRTPRLADALRQLRNVTVLDRPVTTQALVSATQAALRGRAWQYRIRDQWVELLAAQATMRLADQRKDEFLATLAHELRNPLAPIKTGLELLARVGHDAPRRERLLGMMDRQLGHLVHLIDDLLEVSRIASGKLELRCECIDLRDVARQAHEACQQQIDQAGHRLTVVLPEHPVFVAGDLTRLVQAVSNLLSNACKYTDRGGQMVLLVSSNSDPTVGAMGAARIDVQDSGLGIPADMIERVFDMFAQVNRTLDRAQGGLGIGLALVRKFVRLHGGEVTAHSAGPGHGSRFTIMLEPLPIESAYTPASTAEGQSSDPLRRLKVLVVDDNVDAAQALAALLALDAHELLVAHDGAQALAAAEHFGPDVVFCDLGLPGLSGLDLAKALRLQPASARARMVAVTGWGSADDRQRSQAAGFDAHLTKPVSTQALVAVLRGAAPASPGSTTCLPMERSVRGK